MVLTCKEICLFLAYVFIGQGPEEDNTYNINVGRPSESGFSIILNSTSEEYESINLNDIASV